MTASIEETVEVFHKQTGHVEYSIGYKTARDKSSAAKKAAVHSMMEASRVLGHEYAVRIIRR